jgi:hypothetical protein
MRPFKSKIDTNLYAGTNLPHGNYQLHSRFTHVLNFSNDTNQLVFLTNKIENLAANGIFVQGIDFETIDYLNISEMCIEIGDHRIDRSLFATYDSTFLYNGICTGEFESLFENLVGFYPALFPEKSLAFLLEASRESFFASGFDFHFKEYAKKGANKILNGDVIAGVKIIKGTGTGLTPAGDDFIAGMLWGLHYLEIVYQKDVQQLRQDIVEASKSKNLLVNSFLEQARSGHYFFSLKNLLHLSIQKSDISTALQSLLSMGATSGGDLLSGYIFTIKHKIGL